MRLPVAGIPVRGRLVMLSPALDWAVEAVRVALEAPPSRLSGELLVMPPVKFGRVDVRAAVQTSAPRCCDRCGEDLELAVDTEVTLSFVPPDGEPADRGEVQVDEDLDFGIYEDGALDLGQVVLDAVGLAVPSRVACTNEVACEARTAALLGETRPAGPFAALRGPQ